MSDQPIQQLTLVEIFNQTGQLTRELCDHLEQGFLPKVESLQGLVDAAGQGADRQQATDFTVHSQVANALNSDDFTHQLCTKLDRFLKAIDQTVQGEIN